MARSRYRCGPDLFFCAGDASAGHDRDDGDWIHDLDLDHDREDGKGVYRPILRCWARATRVADSAAAEVRSSLLAGLVVFGIVVYAYVGLARIGSRHLPGGIETAPVVWKWIIA
ncbi:MAG TPA: hypothetical protein VFR10_12930 [bacterium]|nr:hypothetical protein [bacterium]